MSIALWYCPVPGTYQYEVLKQLIVSLQTIFPTSPLFEPHITLATKLQCENKEKIDEILTSCVAAVQSIKGQLQQSNGTPLVSFDECCINKKFFKKVTLNCNQNKYLVSMARIMQELYSEGDGEDANGTWEPHVSLLYSDVTPISKAFVRIIQQRIEDALDVRLIEDTSIASNEQYKNDIQTKWKFDRKPSLNWNLPGSFKIVRCEGPIGEWMVIGRIDI
ncbi:hypothetical protein KAFR_0B04390 [Kazachstania africana CBS 2517]|uniref:2',3'-cyclic-nucleotide 3'-phosphodiesterase n=1 Tax=Kazachstania africana (strain ATCC 22294 / BCRC 22015 / CBS 2517 / CECT 1963 / NBRC 1671 / NRRL Y-8276) TaxID=1071382 RepID=H2AQT5_KAZAF|nr:hypothetical protein KAFR_0B04390 [Kazachstania africana CBS 2517]CCF56735.1 hypothetical protein KAFR_0B04390 [Kazachstania africana CBS 2517]